MFKFLFRTALIIAGFICLTVPTFAWDETGHKITAYIAWQHMRPEARERVISILRAAPEDSDIATFFISYGSRDEESRKREFFMLLASWADIIRDKSFDTRYKKYHHGDWHYSDTFWQSKGGKAVIIDSDESSGKAMQKITDFAEVIRGKATNEEKAVAIVWLEHLIGDVHQPLHTSAKVTDSNPKGDQGGNLFFLTPKGTPRDRQQNLHSYWDGIIGKAMPNDKDQCDADYIDPIARDIMRKYPYDIMKKRLKLDMFDRWAKESFDIAISDVYRDIKFFELPSEAYKKRSLETAEERMALAGYRMGELFNEVFSSPDQKTVKN